MTERERRLRQRRERLAEALKAVQGEVADLDSEIAAEVTKRMAEFDARIKARSHPACNPERD